MATFLIDDYLIKNYRDTCEKIPNETNLLIEKIKDEIKENHIRKYRGEEKNHKLFRLTGEQHELARQGFKSFFDRLNDFTIFYEEYIGVGSVLSPLYDVFYNVKIALESYTRSMFCCLRCGEIVPVSKLQVTDQTNNNKLRWSTSRIAYHRCEDEEFGSGNRSSWLAIYATFVRNEYLKEAFNILDMIMTKIKNTKKQKSL